MKRELERIEIPGEHEARERSWAVVRAAFDEREPEPRRRSWKPVAALAVAVVVVAGLVSSPGRAVLDEIREAVGVEHAQPGLFSLPAPGRLLVDTEFGAWVVEPDGSKRLLGDYRETAWSPFGRFVAASRPNELAALTPDGKVRWSLARPDVRAPSWSGTATDTRIAFVTDSRLHVVGGDGRGDVDAGGMPAPEADIVPAWRPRHRFELAYADTRGRVHAFAVTGPGVTWRSIAIPDGRRLEWAPDGKRLLVVGLERLVSLRGSDGRATVTKVPGVTAAAFAPDGRLAVARTVAGRTELLIDGDVRFSGTAEIGELVWSPNGTWLLFTLPRADQLVFVRTRGSYALRAVANVSRQFRSRFPTVRGWCCAR